VLINCFTYRIIFCVGLVCSIQTTLAQSESQLLKKSNSHFQKQEYNKAISGFRQLLSKDLENIDYTYKYAVCLFYVDHPRSSQKYFDYLISQSGFPNEVYYFKGRIFHLNYQFDRAIEMYRDYENMKSRKDVDYHCSDEIKRCQNAINLLKSPKAIEVISMEQRTTENFFSSYIFDSLNFKLYSVNEYFSKYNKKHQFTPKYIFRRGMKYRFFSSYTKDAEKNKDIFIQKKDSDNEWLEPVALSESINGIFNEDFPFYDEETGYLYFSSDGHNSIGGLDIFRMKFDMNSYSTGEVENLNFPYSSTYDDFLFIPLQPTGNVYFTTNRNVEYGFTEVVKSRFNTPELPTYLSRLSFNDQINTQNTSAQFYLTSLNSGENFGPFNSDEHGVVNFLIPAPGIYNITTTVEGSQKSFDEQVNFPPKVEGFDFEILCSYKMKDSKEEVTFEERLSDVSSVVENVENIEFQEFSKLIVNTETIQANLGPDQADVSTLKEEELVNKIEEYYDIEVEMEDQIRQKQRIAEDLVKTKVELAKLDEKISDLNSELRSSDNVNSTVIKEELSSSFKERKALIDNYEKQEGYYNKFAADEDLKRNYEAIALINEKINEKAYEGNTDSVRTLIKKYTVPSSFTPLEPSVPDLARSDLKVLENELQYKEDRIEEINTEISADKAELKKLNETLISTSNINDWNVLSDSINTAESRISSKTKELKNLSNDSEVLAKEVYRSQESLLKLSLIDTEQKEPVRINKEELSISETVKSKYLSDEVYISNLKEKDEAIVQLKNERSTLIENIEESNLPEPVKDSILLVHESKFIEEIKLSLDDELNESNNDLNELIQLAENNIEVISNESNEIAITTEERVETTEETTEAVTAVTETTSTEPESTTELTSNETTTESTTEERAESTEETTEAVTAVTETTSTDPESTTELTSSETITESVAEERVETTEETTEAVTAVTETTSTDPESTTELTSNETATENVTKETSLITTNDITAETKSYNKSVQFLTSLVLDGNISMSNEMDPTKSETDRSDLSIIEEQKKFFEKELEIEIDNEKMSNKYASLKKEFSNLELEDKKDIEAQIRELKIKENDFRQRIETSSSINEKTLILKLIEANNDRVTLLENKLSKLKISDVEPIDLPISKIERTDEVVEDEEYFNYIVKRNNLESDHILLNELILENEKEKKKLNQSLRNTIAKNEITPEQLEKIKEIEKLQNAISYLEQKIERDKEQIQMGNNAKSYEYLYENKVNPVVSSEQDIISLNTTETLNSSIENIGIKLNSKDSDIGEAEMNSKSFESYSEKRALLSVKINELKGLDKKTRVESNILNDDENLKVEEYVYAKKRNRIEQEILDLVGEMKSLDSAELYEGVFNREEDVFNREVTLVENNINSNRVNRFILDQNQNKVSLESDFAILRDEVVEQNKGALPIIEANPSGLNFRVQVGAFRRTVREDVYREFTPVSGQKLDNGLTVYMAGYFNNSTDAVSAQKSIRRFGYSDAFIVSYCNDERLPFWKGKEHERKGTCRASERNDLIAINERTDRNKGAENIENTERNEGAENIENTERNISNTNPNSNSQAESNSNSENREEISGENSNQTNSTRNLVDIAEQHGNKVVKGVGVPGLFYTVQVGAYRRKIRGAELSEINELNYYESSGLFRYSSGKFDAIQKARDRRVEVVSKGISDAFIVAFYNGERISIREANNLLQTQGKSILYTKELVEISSSEPRTNVNNSSSVRPSTISRVPVRNIEVPIIENKKDRKQSEKISFSLKVESYEHNTIERLNRVGVFKYNDSTRTIESQIIDKSEITPIMSLYVTGMKEQEFDQDSFVKHTVEIGNKISGKFANWLLRSNKLFSFMVINGIENVIFYLDNESEKLKLKNELIDILK